MEFSFSQSVNYVVAFAMLCALVRVADLFSKNAKWNSLIFSPWSKKVNSNKDLIILQAAYLALVFVSVASIGYLCLSTFGKVPDLKKAIIAIVDTETLLFKICFACTGLWAGFFWGLRRTFEAKWTYAANLFNDISKIKVEDRLDYLLKESLRVSLAVDIHLMEFEEHPSFKAFCNEVFKNAAGQLELNSSYSKKEILIEYQKDLFKDIQTFEDCRASSEVPTRDAQES